MLGLMQLHLPLKPALAVSEFTKGLTLVGS